MSKNTELKVNVTADVVQAQQKLKDVDKTVKQLGQTQSSLPAPKLATANLAAYGAAALAAVAAVGKLVSVAKEYVQLATVQQQAETKIAATIKATGNVIGVTTNEMLQLASSLQSVTTYGDETTLGVEQLMIATKAISKDVLPQATELSLDLATAMGTDATNAAKKLAKALADPKTGFEGLRDANIVFSEAEKATIKSMVDSGQQLEAQQIILDKVAGTYGGLAREVAATDTGKIQQINNVIGDIKEGLGTALVSSLGPAFDWILTQLNRFSKWMADQNLTRDLQKDIDSGLASKKYSSTAMQQYYDQLLVSYNNAVGVITKEFDGQMPTDKQMNSKLYGKVLIGALANNASSASYGTAVDTYRDLKDLLPALQTAIAEAKKSEEVYGTANSFNGGAESSVVSTGTSASATDTIRTVNDLIKEQASLSKIAQTAAVDATLAEAQGYLDVAEAGSEDAKILQEIIAGLEERKKTINATDTKKETATLQDYIKANSSLSVNAQKDIIETQRAETVTWQNMTEAGSAEYAILQQIIDSLDEQMAAFDETTETAKTLADVLKENQSLSDTAQIAAVDAKIAEVELYTNAINLGEEESKMLAEILEGLQAQKAALEGNQTAVQKLDDFFKTYGKGIGSLIDAGFGLADQLLDNQIASLESALEAMQDKWDDYFDDLEKKNETHEKALEIQYENGEISAEDYYAAVEEMENAKAEKEQEAQDAEEAQQAQINELKRKQFMADKANSIAQATISGAQAVIGFLANPGGIPGIVLASMAGVTTGLQIATIAAQQYTPMATGGIVTAPTHALIGEAGPEAIVPLSKGEQYGLEPKDKGNINLTIQMGDVYTDDELSQKIFEGITRAQRTGALPNWRTK